MCYLLCGWGIVGIFLCRFDLGVLVLGFFPFIYQSVSWLSDLQTIYDMRKEMFEKVFFHPCEDFSLWPTPIQLENVHLD